jgi:hypothetical protein
MHTYILIYLKEMSCPTTYDLCDQIEESNCRLIYLNFRTIFVTNIYFVQ